MSVAAIRVDLQLIADMVDPATRALADADLRDYPDDAFEYVILSQTLQATREPREVLRQMLRVGKRAIISFPNFAHWQVRLRLVFGGRMPETPSLQST